MHAEIHQLPDGFRRRQTTALSICFRHGLQLKQPKMVARARPSWILGQGVANPKPVFPHLYDPLPQPHWIPYNTFLRIASEGRRNLALGL